MTDTIYLFGAGSSVQTKALRRTARFKPRSFRIGNIPFRPKRRVTVTLDWVRANLAEVVRHIESGQLIVQHSHDDFVDPAELAALLGVAPAVVEAITEAQSKSDTEPAPPVDQEKDAPPAEDPPANLEPAAPAEPAPVAAVEPAVTESPAVEAAPVTAVATRPSDEALNGMNRAALVALCGELGITVEDSDTKKMLVAKIVAR